MENLQYDIGILILEFLSLEEILNFILTCQSIFQKYYKTKKYNKIVKYKTNKRFFEILLSKVNTFKDSYNNRTNLIDITKYIKFDKDLKYNHLYKIAKSKNYIGRWEDNTRTIPIDHGILDTIQDSPQYSPFLAMLQNMNLSTPLENEILKFNNDIQNVFSDGSFSWVNYQTQLSKEKQEMLKKYFIEEFDITKVINYPAYNDCKQAMCNANDCKNFYISLLTGFDELTFVKYLVKTEKMSLVDANKYFHNLLGSISDVNFTESFKTYVISPN
jgi:hypothetical protein